MNKKYKQNFLQAGKLAQQVRAYGKSLITRGASYNTIIQQINEKILELGGTPAFPPQMALNDVAAHFLPQPHQDIIFSNEVVKLDIGVAFEGAIGDCAVTVDLSGKNEKLIEAVEAALLKAEQSIKVGLKVKEIGRIIDETISSYGFRPIRNLSGHGLGPYQVHTAPSIPNYEVGSAIIRPGMTFAIEPFATTGRGFIDEEGEATIFSFKSMKPVQQDISRTLITKIKSFNGLPFSFHNLLEPHFDINEIKKGVAELLKNGVILGYPPLVEQKGSVVAQAENSVLVDEKGQVFITTR